MNKPICRILFAAITLFLTPLIARGQFIDLVVDISAFGFRYPSVSSYAEAVLYGPNGAREYSIIILGHEVWKNTSLYPLVYQGRFTSDTGLANNLVNLPGEFDLCYVARASGYSTHYGFGYQIYSFPVCISPPEIDPIDVPKENCPIVLDLKRDGFHLSGTDPAVSFDIDADGAKEKIAWTQAGTDEAFLCLDRNHNGVIDDGTELFGYVTPLISGKPAKIGYRALAEFDQKQLGGNEDGKIDAADAGYSELCLWVDENRNGISEAGEIYDLSQKGIKALYYDYQKTRITDSFGNAFRYVSRADMDTPTDGIMSWPTFDVLFAGQ